MDRIYAELEKGTPARLISMTDEEKEMARDLFLLTSKPVIYAANVGEDDVANGGNEYVSKVQALGRALDKSGYVYKFKRRRRYLFAVIKFSQKLQPLVRYRHYSNVKRQGKYTIYCRQK